MDSFRGFIETQSIEAEAISVIKQLGFPQDILENKQPEVWHAQKDDILELWRNLRPVPLQMEPIPENSKGSRLSSDGVRITGNSRFINAVLGRIKELIQYEDQPGVRLDIEYRQIETKIPNSQPKYLCYIHAESDSKKKPKKGSLNIGGLHLPDADSITKPSAKSFKTLEPPDLKI
jgi:hypothetical protein